ncbi:hypothetical protein LCGC14_1824810 [marine sediment metagenome]|uniref:Uncharacterized protein n=1 Tax=marine sediment metagenome TaxID=412755 RepID=A0A0F9GHU5_9ZZZZ
MNQQEVWKTISNDVKHWFHVHKFVTYGDAFGWWQVADWGSRVTLAGNKEGQSAFEDEIIYLVSQFGPSAKIELPSKPRSKKPLPKTAPEPRFIAGSSIKKK